MRDRSAEGTFPSGAVDIDVDPLTIAGAVGELVDPLLIHDHPVGHAELAAHASFMFDIVSSVIVILVRNCGLARSHRDEWVGYSSCV